MNIFRFIILILYMNVSHGYVGSEACGNQNRALYPLELE